MTIQQCATPGCTRRRNGSAYHCTIHIRPADAILRTVVNLLRVEPSADHDTIARRCFISISTVRRALRTLEQDGVITPLMRQVVRELEEYSDVR